VKLSFLCAFFFLVGSAFIAEASVNDSLKLLNNLKQATTPAKKIEASVQLSEVFQQKNITRAMLYAKQCIEIATPTNNPDLIGKAYATRAEVNFISGDYDEARIDFEQSFKEFSSSGDQIGIGEAYAGLGKVAYKLGENDIALKDFSKAI